VQPSDDKLAWAERLFQRVRWEHLPPLFCADLLRAFSHPTLDATSATPHPDVAFAALAHAHLDSAVRSATPPAAARGDTASLLAAGAADSLLGAACTPSRLGETQSASDAADAGCACTTPWGASDSLGAASDAPPGQCLPPLHPPAAASAAASSSSPHDRSPASESPDAADPADPAAAGTAASASLPFGTSSSTDSLAAAPANAATPGARGASPPPPRLLSMLRAVSGDDAAAAAGAEPWSAPPKLRALVSSLHRSFLCRAPPPVSAPPPPPRAYTWGTLRMTGGQAPQPARKTARLASNREHVVGRSRKSDVRIGQNAPMPYISGQHFRLFHKAAYPNTDDFGRLLSGAVDARLEPWIEDLSQNGTFVNGVLVGKGQKRKLSHKDRIELVFPLDQQPLQNYTFPTFTFFRPGPPARDSTTQTAPL